MSERLLTMAFQIIKEQEMTIMDMREREIRLLENGIQKDKKVKALTKFVAELKSKNE